MVILFEWLCHMLNTEPQIRPSAKELLDRLGYGLPAVPRCFYWEELFLDPEKEPHTTTPIRYNEVYSAIRSLFGEQHIKAIVSGTRLAYAYQLTGQCGLAKSLFKQIVKIQRLAEEAGERVEWGMTLYGLGQTYLYLADQTSLHIPDVSEADEESRRLREKGRECFQECQSLHQTRSGIQDPNALLSNYGVALAHSKFYSRQSQAISVAYFTHQWQSQSKDLGQDHRDTMATKSLLLTLRDEKGKRVKTLLSLKEIWKKRQRSLGGEHPDTLDSLACLGWYCYFQGKQEGVKYMQDSLDGRVRLLGWRHPKTVTSVNGLAWIHNAIKKPNIGLFEKAEDLLRVTFGTNDRRTQKVTSRLETLRRHVK